jgi:xanthosine phosphorylase
MSQYAYQATKIIQERCPDFKPKVGIILSSGLDVLVQQLTKSVTLDYNELPGFPNLSVKGHAGQLYLGYLNKTPVVCLVGRAHTYEKGLYGEMDGKNVYDEVKTYVRTLKLLGCEYYIATNVSGSLREDFAPGEQVLIRDHINFQPGNPLAGRNDDDFGPRFPPLDQAYNDKLNHMIRTSAEELNMKLHEGVYISVLGPSYETAAEIRAFRQWGAEVIGMSTVPEVIIANHCGLKTAVIATITNYATGIATTSHDHDDVVEMGKKAASKVCALITATLAKI